MLQALTETPTVLAGLDVGKTYLLQSHSYEIMFLVDGDTVPDAGGSAAYWLRRCEFLTVQRVTASEEVYVWSTGGNSALYGQVFYREAI